MDERAIYPKGNPAHSRFMFERIKEKDLSLAADAFFFANKTRHFILEYPDDEDKGLSLGEFAEKYKNDLYSALTILNNIVYCWFPLYMVGVHEATEEKVPNSKDTLCRDVV